jgi:hypothetical protein
MLTTSWKLENDQHPSKVVEELREGVSQVVRLIAAATQYPSESSTNVELLGENQLRRR